MIPSRPRSEEKAISYGELVVMGHNGCIKTDIATSNQPKSSFTSSRRKSKFSLQSRHNPNGVKPCTQHTCQNNQELSNLMNKNNSHSVTYTLSRSQTIVVKYISDDKTDMFQIGRSSETAIDFIVLDTVLSNENRSCSPTLDQAQTSLIFPKLPKTPLSSNTTANNQLVAKCSQNKESTPSTISRYACRILVDREYPYTARIYAAGFDSSKRIFLGEKATKWKNEKGEMDGVTTNGVLIMHPSKGFEYNESSYNESEWMEVSVGGAVFNLNESRLSPCLNLINNNNNHLQVNKNESKNSCVKSNILLDGTLIDLCGATLLWRSKEGLTKTPSNHFIEVNLENLNRLRPQCPVGFKTLVFSSSLRLNNNRLTNNTSAISSPNSIERTPMVYLKCGHVHGHHNWGITKDNERECPLCRKIGPYVQLVIGLESSFYCDKHVLSSLYQFKPYAFLPCGHMASEVTCKYWSKILVPQGVTQGLWSICPFCAVPLCKEQPFVKLIFQEGI